MKRREFLKKTGAAVVAVPLAPVVARAVEPERATMIVTTCQKACHEISEMFGVPYFKAAINEIEKLRKIGLKKGTHQFPHNKWDEGYHWQVKYDHTLNHSELKLFRTVYSLNTNGQIVRARQEQVIDS